ncbi:hypothetical protein LH29_23420 [Draconibacterium sediminis]|uniref:Uncharacterized protein n=2 Tax=Draconibacterium sediminis TaxID=1544798 RepID=A0A0D8J7W7_9BACT|nr:hypothetical protein LH29_23420 [Draconibacterium sediminis]
MEVPGSRKGGWGDSQITGLPQTLKFNKMQNRISFVLSDEERTAINQSLETLVNILEPKLVSLTTDERKEMPKMVDKTVAFVSKALDYGEEYSNYIPDFIDVPEAKTDFRAVQTMRTFYTQLERLTNGLDDSMTLAGSEAYSSALSIYKVLKNAAAMEQSGAEEAVNDLANRFPRGKRSRTPEAN